MVTRKHEDGFVTFQQSEHFLTELVVKVAVLGVGHVVDEHQPIPLGLQLFQGNIQLARSILEKMKKEETKRYPSQGPDL